MARLQTFAGIVVLASLFACSEPPAGPSPPKAIRAVTATTLSGTVGAAVPGGITVRVIDYSDEPLEGAKVGFSVTGGDGSVSHRLAVTDAEGIAHTEWTLGQTAGPNEVVASIFGLDSTATFTATGAAGPAIGLSITPRILRIPSTSGGSTIVGRVIDQFGNIVTGNPTYTSRNTGVVTVSNSGAVSVVNNNRGVSTWIIVTGGGFTDSAEVFNLSATDPPCTGITAMAPLAVGEVKTTGFVDNGICVPAAAGDREYALVPFYDSPVPSAQTQFVFAGFGIRGTSTVSLGAVRDRANLSMAGELDTPNAREGRVALDRRLRLAERREITSRAAGARQWYSSRGTLSGRRATRATVPAVGDQMQLNVNDQAFCDQPVMRTGRVVAVTTRAVVVADIANPQGYTDAEYASFGASFDTLVYVSDAANFGAPTDIDENGRVVLFFTHAVNEISSGVLGFQYSRDLLPKSGALGSCPGSNVAELLYIRVPDPILTVAQAKVDVLATLAHELQHAINFGRRLYVNTSAAPTEERWLNEGLSHIAEELLFYRSTGLAPRQNLGGQLAQAQSAFSQFLFRNFSRYWLFTRNPGLQSPVGLNDEDDDLESRGAIWSLLRYAADQRHTANETAFWQNLTNANSTGMQNLYEHIGADARLVVRDWAISNFLDDLVPTDTKYTQPSFNLRSVPGFQSPVVFTVLAPSQTTPTNATSNVTLSALATEFIRFGVGNNQEAYVTATGFPANTNTPLPRNVLLAIVRTK